MFHQQRVGPKYPLDNNGNFLLSEAVGAFQYPHRLRERKNTHEPRALFRQTLFHNHSGFVRLHWVVLRKVPDQNVCIEANHFRVAALYLSVIPAAIASSISSRVARRELLTMPRKAETGILGNRKTVPLGCTKNLTRSPGLRWRCSRMAFGIVAWPLLVIADSMLSPLHFLECNTTFGGSQTGLLARQISDRLHVTYSCEETCHELPRSHRATR